MVVERRPGWFVPRTYQGKMLRPGRSANGYIGVFLRAQGEGQHRLVQYIVLEAFVGPRPKGAYCCHSDGSKINNSLSNLRWDTPTANCHDAELHGTKTMGERVAASVLSESDVREIRALAGVVPRSELAKRYGVAAATIGEAIRRVTWRHLD